jgi:hypothetical protein
LEVTARGRAGTDSLPSMMQLAAKRRRTPRGRTGGRQQQRQPEGEQREGLEAVTARERQD